MRGLGDIMNVLMGLLPPWATDIATVALALIAGVGALYWSQMRRIRGTVRRMVKASPAEQERLAAQAERRGFEHDLTHRRASRCRRIGRGFTWAAKI